MKLTLAIAALLMAILTPTAAADNGVVANWGACHPIEVRGTAPGQLGAGPFTIVQTPNGTRYITVGNWAGWEGCYR